MNKQEVLKTVVEACQNRLAEDCVVLDMENITPIADYFVICEASNERQVQAIARAVKEAMDKLGLHIKKMEGFDQGRWILLDFDYVICHVFHKEERDFYNLERLWGDAPIVAIEEII